ncbi:MAG TPA: DUF1080 domain-containing protein [Chitinophagaceae bacterium]|nr:DUF1080 domain-containing protein [Chitinophagaceae bacterium]
MSNNTPYGPQTSADGWTTLFDGHTLIGWHPYQGKNPDNWEAKDGVLHCVGGGENHDRHVDLVTNDSFQNFELSIDWKIAPKGNSGIIYLANETMPAAYQTGPEYQLIDDANFPEKLEDWQKTGANYAMNPAPSAKPAPVGEWNQTRIVVNNGHVEHWLNGDKIVTYEIDSDEWKGAKATGKWKDTPTYGTVKAGHIALQDHGSEAWFKAIKIRRL